MRYTRAAIFFATGYLAISASALPKPNPAATYSVVDVGGPSSTEAADPAETVYATVDEPEQTVYSTVKAPAKTIYATVTEPSTPETVTQQSTPTTVVEALTVTAAASTEAPTTKGWTVTIGGTEVSALSTTLAETTPVPIPVVAATDTVFYGEPPSPSATVTVSYGEPLSPSATVTGSYDEPAPATTKSVFYGVPPAATPSTSSTSCSTSSRPLRSAFPSAISQWSHNTSSIALPTAIGSSSFRPSGVAHPTGRGAYR